MISLSESTHLSPTLAPPSPLEQSILRCPHPQTLLAPAHAPRVLPLLLLNQDWKKRHHHQRQRKRHPPYHDTRINCWIYAVGALVFSDADRPPACALDMSVGERKSVGRGGAGRGGEGRGGAGRGGAGRGGAERETGYHAEIFEKINMATVNHLLSSESNPVESLSSLRLYYKRG